MTGAAAGGGPQGGSSDGPPRPSKEMVARMFDGAASDYDRHGPSVFAQYGARLVELTPLALGAHVLDVASGAGAALMPAARRVGPDGRVSGVDLSDGMLREARDRAWADGLTNTEFLQMDAEHLDFRDGEFDAVVCAHGIFLLPDREAALREMVRVTKPGGTVGVSIFGNTPPAFMPAWSMLVSQLADFGVQTKVPNPLAYYTPQEMEHLFLLAGLQSVDVVSETTDAVYPSIDDWWAFLLTMAPRMALLSMDERTQMRFKAEYFERLNPLLSQDGLHLPVSVVYAVGRC